MFVRVDVDVPAATEAQIVFCVAHFVVVGDADGVKCLHRIGDGDDDDYDGYNHDDGTRRNEPKIVYSMRSTLQRIPHE